MTLKIIYSDYLENAKTNTSDSHYPEKTIVYIIVCLVFSNLRYFSFIYLFI